MHSRRSERWRLDTPTVRDRDETRSGPAAGNRWAMQARRAVCSTGWRVPRFVMPSWQSLSRIRWDLFDYSSACSGVGPNQRSGCNLGLPKNGNATADNLQIRSLDTSFLTCDRSPCLTLRGWRTPDDVRRGNASDGLACCIAAGRQAGFSPGLAIPTRGGACAIDGRCGVLCDHRAVLRGS